MMKLTPTLSDRLRGCVNAVSARMESRYLFASAMLLMLSMCVLLHLVVVHEFRLLRSTAGHELEIRLIEESLGREGIGAVLSGLKPVLLLRNKTGARLAYGKRRGSRHGYNINRYLRVDREVRTRRVECNLSMPLPNLLGKISEQCHDFNFETIAAEYGVFNHCNTVTVRRYLNHPRTCLKHTQDLVRDVTTFALKDEGEKNDVCVLRRGGDIEQKIMSGVGNMWAVDEEKTLPVLAEVSKRGARIVVTTETRFPEEVRQKYHPDVFSNKESIEKVVSHLSRCRCLFVASGSSFHAAMVQLTQPTYIVHTKSREGFEYTTPDYEYGEYGSQAVSVLSGTNKLVDLCAPRANGTVAE